MMDRKEQKQLFDDMLGTLESKGLCRYRYHYLRDILFPEDATEGDIMRGMGHSEARSDTDKV
jgi:hypothetical protein